MAALALAAPSMPAAVGPLAGVKDGANVNGQNSATLVFSGGSTGADTIPSAGGTGFLDTLPADSRLYEVFNTSFATQADLDAALAALGFQATIVKGASALAFVTAAPGKPTATITTTGAAGSIRISLAASVSR